MDRPPAQAVKRNNECKYGQVRDKKGDSSSTLRLNLRGANKSHLAWGYKFEPWGAGKTELPSRESLEMSLLLFTLISTALAMPAHDCPPFPPADCGEGMRSCPGDTDPMGCPMPEICVAEGDECPFFCPHVEHPHCGFVMSNCPGPVDANGCETPMNCVMVDWAAGEQCPPPAEAAAESCMPWSPVDCGEGMKSCPGNFDHRACPMPDICIAEGDECPYVCPPLKHPHCGFAMSNCAGPVDAMGCETPMNCIMVDWAAGEQCPPPAEAVAANCGPWTIADCGDGKGMKSCPGELDARGCPGPDICVAEGDADPMKCVGF